MVAAGALTRPQAEQYALAAARAAGLDDVEAERTIVSAFSKVIS
jgi:hypothetical protein